MVKDELFQERVVRVEKPSAHFTLLRNPNGEFLGVSDTNAPAVFDYVDDKAIWEQVKGVKLEQKELEAIMVNKMVGPAGHLAITVDEELTEKIRGTQ